MLSKTCQLACLFMVALTLNLAAKPLVVGLSVWSGYPDNIAGFKASLVDAGFIENTNISYLYRNAGADKGKQQLIAKEFAEKQVDLVYSLTTPGTMIVKAQLPQSIPIVFSIVTYPADSGLIESFEYSGNNLVGTSNFVPLNHNVNLLTTMMPKAKKVAIFHRQGEPNSKIQTINLMRLFKRAGIEAIDASVISLEDIDQQALPLSEQVDAFVTTTDTLMQSGGEKRLIAISRQKNIPVLSSNKQGVLNGSTFGAVADFYTLGTLSGEMAAQILQGNKQPTGMQSKLQEPPLILMNKLSLKALGLTVPASLKNVSYVE